MFVSNRSYYFGYNNLVRYSLIALIIAGIFSLGYFGYSWYSKRNEQAAFKDLTENIDAYYKKIASADSQQAWTDLERAFARGAQLHKSSELYPYFLAYQAEALLHMDKRDEAISLLNTVVKYLDKKPLYYLYATKLALIKTDSKQESVRNEGLKELENLAKDSNNIINDMAIYYLGLNAYYAQDKAKAAAIWNELVSSGKTSNWVYMAQEKLMHS